MGTINTLETYVKNNLIPSAVVFVQQRWVQLLVAFILGAVAISVWDNYNTKLAMERELRKIDSLRIEIAHLNREYTALKTRADSLDVELVEANLDREKLRGSFPNYKRPKIDNASDAYKFLKDFSKETK